jgi:hypothetical protein
MRHRHPPLCRFVLIALTLIFLSPLAPAESHNPADYPLRVHIYRLNRHTRYFRGMVEWVDGEGRANLFENGDPKGLDFAYTCSDRFMNSSGFETYPAKWKKSGRSLILLLHQIGSTSMDTCELKVDVKDFAYVSHNGVLTTEPTSVFKEWMIKQQYDPEHGKDQPAFTQRQSAPPPQTSAPEPGVQ